MQALDEAAGDKGILVKHRDLTRKNDGQIVLVKPCGNTVTIGYTKAENRKIAFSRALELVECI